MKLQLTTLLVFALFAVLAYAQDNYNDVDVDGGNDDDDGDDGDRDARQVSAYAFQAPSGECIRAWREFEYCGGFRGGNGGSCDRHCLQKGFPLSWCRNQYCLCHRGKDLGKECEIGFGRK